MLTVDEMVGDLEAQAAAQGRTPYWIFTSDNGMAWGADGFPLKNVPESDRIPFYVAGPDVVRGSTDALISNIDISPTIADLAGTAIPNADGVSFKSVLFGGGGGRSAMMEDHPVGGPTGSKGASGPWWGIRTPDWHYVNWNGEHLYLTRTDPWEEHDVAKSYPGQIAALSNMKSALLGNDTNLLPEGPLGTPEPTPEPTQKPPKPTEEPTPEPTPEETPIPTPTPTPDDTPTPTQDDTPTPTQDPTPSPTPTPTPEPTPTDTPTPTPQDSPAETLSPADTALPVARP
jgi:hypothetical protein